MASTYTEGYRIGFINGRKDITKKKTVNIRYSLGFERMVKAAILQFREMGLKPVIYRHATHAVNKRGCSHVAIPAALPIRSTITIIVRTVHCSWTEILCSANSVPCRLLMRSTENWQRYMEARPALTRLEKIRFSPVSKPEAYRIK